VENPQASAKVCRPSPDEDAGRETRAGFDGCLAVGDRMPIRSTVATGDEGLDCGALRLIRPPVRPESNLQPIHGIKGSETGRARTLLGGAGERRRLERDLHDGVQSELVALIVKLSVAQQAADTPPALADMLAGLEARAQAALDAVRNIARGIYPPVLADFGVREALRAQAARAAVHVALVGTVPRSAEEAEEAVYFACSEAIQNAAKHAGRGSQVTLRLQHEHRSLTVRIADDGRGFDPDRTRAGAGLKNIRDRIQDLGGTFTLASAPGRGAVLTLALPWPPAAERRQ